MANVKTKSYQGIQSGQLGVVVTNVDTCHDIDVWKNGITNVMHKMGVVKTNVNADDLWERAVAIANPSSGYDIVLVCNEDLVNKQSFTMLVPSLPDTYTINAWIEQRLAE